MGLIFLSLKDSSRSSHQQVYILELVFHVMISQKLLYSLAVDTGTELYNFTGNAI